MQYKEIQKKFNEIIKYSQCIENPNTDELFKNWLEAKRDFIEAMGGRLIWEWPEKVSFELGPKEKSLRIDDFITLVNDRYGNENLADFIEQEREGFFSNTVVQPYMSDGIQVPKGMKLLKAFKFFESDSKVLNNLQSAASMIIQEDKIEGTLCLSVHPLDYLSASENNHNWRSCHALDGEYRAGNLSYMIDKSTIMCYLKSPRMEKLPNFPEDVLWNSKKWRVFLYFSESWDMLFAGRQYPFYTETGINFVKERVLPIVHMNEWTPWLTNKIRSTSEKGIISHFRSPYVPVGTTLVQLNELVINEPGSLQFNDLLSSSCYDAMYAYRVEEGLYREWMSGKYPKVSNFTKIKVGGECKCLRCAEIPIELSETFMCNECEMNYGTSDSDTFAICPCCGGRFIFDDGYWVDGAEETVCENCADNYTEVCGNCGERYYKYDMIYDRKGELFICKWCAEDIDIDIEGDEE